MVSDFAGLMVLPLLVESASELMISFSLVTGLLDVMMGMDGYGLVEYP